MNRDKLFSVVVYSLAFVIVAVVSVMLIGLFIDRVDNKAIFDIIKPTFQMIIGAFVGVIGGRALGKE